MTAESLNIAGIDYGSKLAGTTVIAAVSDGRLRFSACPRGRDADEFIRAWVFERNPSHLFIDAPLSLPGVYRGLSDCRDYFYREADRAAAAMSPMFLGGLTARAMRLADDLRPRGVRPVEVYPALLARELGLDPAMYKKDRRHLPGLLAHLVPILPPVADIGAVADWHHFDALLAWISGRRYCEKKHRSFGRPDEGLIVV